MLNLFKKKLYKLQILKNYTKEILSLSVKYDDEKISSMITERQRFMDDIDLINDEIDKYIDANKDSYVETNEIAAVRSQIKEIIQEIIKMDKIIRKGVNDELISVKAHLNRHETSSNTLNMKF